MPSTSCVHWKLYMVPKHFTWSSDTNFTLHDQCLALTVHFTLSCVPYMIECRKYTLYMIDTQICQCTLHDIKIALYMTASYFLQGIVKKWNICYVSKCICCVRNPKLHVIKLYWFTVCVMQRCNQQVKLSGLAIITPWHSKFDRPLT